MVNPSKSANLVVPQPEQYRKDDNIEIYVFALENWLHVSDFEKKKWTGIAISVIGTYALSQIMNFDKENVLESSFEDFKKILLDRFSKKQPLLYERAKFWKLTQGANESITDYVNKLKDAAARCEFPKEQVEDRLLEKLVSSLRNERIIDVIFSKKDVTWREAVSLATLKEDREKGKTNTDELSISKLSVKPEKSKSSITCFCCGNKGHLSSECSFKRLKCRNCNKEGHIAKVCKAKPKGKGSASVKLVELNSILNNSEGIKRVLKIGGKPITFEVDTGAEITVISEKEFNTSFKGDKLEKSNIVARTASGSLVPCIGEIRVMVDKKQCKIRIIKGSGVKNLLGRDILNILFPDWKNAFIGLIKQDSKKLIDQLKIENENVFSSENGSIKGFTATIKLKEEVKPIFARPYGMPLALKAKVEDELDRLVRSEVIEKVNYSQWSSPIVVVPKKDGKVRICVDFKKTVNPAIHVNQYPIPLIEDITNKIGGGAVFTVLDLSNAYQQLKVDRQSVELLTINTHKGLYRYKRLPFGISSAPAIFQGVMDQILSNMPKVACYLDDIIITGENLEECHKNVNEVMKRLNKHNVKINQEKSVFFEDSVSFLGYEISKDGIRPSESKLKVLGDTPCPKNLTEVRAFLGFINYYRKFIRNLADVLNPLYELERKGRKFEWSDNCQKSFEKSIDLLRNSDAITHFDEARKTCLTTDASDYGLGAVLSQLINGEERVVCFWSRVLTDAERKFPQVQKEALAIVEAVKKFHKYLYGRKFYMITDHRPLKTIFGEKNSLPQYTINRLQNYAIFLSGYTYEIAYRKGNQICNADGLSRLPSDKESNCSFLETEVCSLDGNYVLLDIKDVQKFTEQDQTLKQVKKFINEGFPVRVDEKIKPYATRKVELHVLNDIIFWNTRLVVPEDLKSRVLEVLHEEHIGICKMKLLARKEVWFPGIDESIERTVKNCESCQKFENKNPVNDSLSHWPKSNKFFDRVHLDYYSKFGKNFIILVDAYSNYIDVKQMESHCAEHLIEYLRDVITLFGFPKLLVSDNGPPFNSSEVLTFMKRNKIKHIFSPPYHPQSNGLVERSVGIVKQNLSKIANDFMKKNEPANLKLMINRFLFKYRNTPTISKGKSPCELIFRHDVTTELSLLRKGVDEEVVMVSPAKFKDGEVVRILRKDHRDGKGNWEMAKILKRLSETIYEVLVNGRVKKAHVGQLKKGEMLYTNSQHSSNVHAQA